MLLIIFIFNEIMEFNVLPRPKLLSPKTNIKSNNKPNQTTTQTVNVIVEERSERTERSTSKINDENNIENNNIENNIENNATTIQVRDVNLNENAENLNKSDSISTIKFLKLVLESYINNPIKFNGYIICSVPVLENLIETITNSDDCTIEIEDFEPKCCKIANKTIVPITKIWVRNNDVCEIFKYKFSHFIPYFEDYHISLKFVYLE